MTTPDRLVAFIGTSDFDSARDFYGGVLGLELADESPFALVADVVGTQLRITKVDEVVVAPYTVLGWAVDDIVIAVDRIAALGVQFLRFDGMTQDERGVWTAPSGTRIAWFFDPDGNTLSFSQS